jgi:hypothetical protein
MTAAALAGMANRRSQKYPKILERVKRSDPNFWIDFSY